MATVTDIKNMSYADFVAYIGQANTPPGGDFTVNRWIRLSSICEYSNVLDLACSTGFSSRQVVLNAKCRAFGIDISQLAINTAIEEAKGVKLNNKLEYSVQDATKLQLPDNTFTHILAGCNFAFIQERDMALAECQRILKKDGYMCTSNFHYISAVPNELLKQVEKAINFSPNPNWDGKYWRNFIRRRFLLLKEENYKLPVIDDEELGRAIYSSIYVKSKKLADKNQEIKKACYDKLLSIRSVLNEHRKYQGFSIAIWKPI